MVGDHMVEWLEDTIREEGLEVFANDITAAAVEAIRVASAAHPHETSAHAVSEILTGHLHAGLTDAIHGVAHSLSTGNAACVNLNDIIENGLPSEWKD